ncbi:hypothetical protein [Paenibacillus sp. Root444D2]|uniref:hypothetical protein n=1 Tax=Paenibacillus sp. Root444D2 TaxID=1736538 RepID=UPI000710792B|nr:hypothetical protein [Paenibacillus sp. Root444D2]KQX69297.1 hypothetical protein ASD40_02000 [Paenibacillus sp. Root444D2]
MKENRILLENAVLKHAAALNPIKIRQIVLALEDKEYEGLLEYTDRDELNPASVNRALKHLAATEPNLFYSPDKAKELDDGGSNYNKSETGGM